MKRLTDIVRRLFAPFVCGGAVVGLLDALARALTTTPTPSDPAEVLAGTAVAALLCVWVGVASVAVVAGPLALVSALVADEDSDPIRRSIALLLGPAATGGRAYLVLIASTVAAVVLSIGLDGLVLMLPLQNIGQGIGRMLVMLTTLPVVLLGVRLVARRHPNLQLPHAATFAILTLTTYVVADRWWEYLSRDTLLVPLAACTSLAGVAIYLGTARRRVVQVVGAAVVVGSIGLAVAYPAGEPHTAAVLTPLFGQPARSLALSATDVDLDGESHLFGGSDCAPFDPEVRPNAMELVGNGVDDNCAGGDLKAPRIAPMPQTPTLAGPAPPVILITVDTLRADYVGREYGGKPLTPALDSLAQSSIRAERAYSASTHTEEALPAILSGMYPSDWHRHGVYFGVERTLPQLLGSVGYQTTAVLSLPWLKKHLVHGLQTVDNSIGSRVGADESHWPDGEVTDLALAYIDNRSSSEPLFLWVHYYGPHGPNPREAGLVGAFGPDGYAHAVHGTDHHIGRFLAGLDERGLFDEAVIAVTSDHGEGLGEHNIETHVWGFWESIIRVPLLIKLPGVQPSTVAGPTSTVDIAPTVVDYLGITGTSPRAGHSLIDAPSERSVFVEVEHRARLLGEAIIRGEFKLVADALRDSEYLSRPADDRDETRNLLDEFPEAADELRLLLDQHRDERFNNERLERKQALFGAQGEWTPRTLRLGDEELRGLEESVPR